MIPEAGEVGWVEFGPVLGTEQAGRRPAVILSSATYHRVSERALVCPISSRAKPWPFHVLIRDGVKVEGFILVDQVRMIHRPLRLFDIFGRVPAAILTEVRGKLAGLAGIEL